MKFMILFLCLILCGCTAENNDNFSATRDAIKKTKPYFPVYAFDHRIEGRVNVVFDIDDNGKVQNLRVESFPAGIFEQSARESVTQWQYRPGHARKAVKTTLVYKFTNHI